MWTDPEQMWGRASMHQPKPTAQIFPSEHTDGDSQLAELVRQQQQPQERTLRRVLARLKKGMAPSVGMTLTRLVHEVRSAADVNRPWHKTIGIQCDVGL